MKTLTQHTAAFLVLCSITLVPLHADEKTEIRETTTVHEDGTVTKKTKTKSTMSDKDRESFRTYIKKTEKSQLPKGFTRTTTYVDEFPETWREKVVIGQPMPEVYYKYSSPVPSDVIAVSDPEISYYALDGNIIRVERTSRRVLDIYTLE
ncbi:hypothetical protein DB346_03385 [Verrucomicrobia bacterium LW23]|nr:hypothetical protein DB346_03385 [Verrucomicrobia bacterium LW23]